MLLIAKVDRILREPMEGVFSFRAQRRAEINTCLLPNDQESSPQRQHHSSRVCHAARKTKRVFRLSYEYFIASAREKLSCATKRVVFGMSKEKQASIGRLFNTFLEQRRSNMSRYFICVDLRSSLVFLTRLCSEAGLLSTRRWQPERLRVRPSN